jgi:glycosyltransferase involved in cell wall biosynthesis
LRVIARLNVGGPAIQAITLSGPAMAARGYQTTLVRGLEGPREGNMDHLARDLGVEPVRIAALRRRIGLHDLAAMLRLLAIVGSVRPHVLHTHAAKAGTVGRLAAALLPRSRRPDVVVHTFHGHVLADYFNRRTTAFFIAIERWLARRSTALIAVSAEVKHDLVRLGIADAARIDVIPLGFDLAPFASSDAPGEMRASVRSELAIGPDERVVTLVARLVPIKRVDRFLQMARALDDMGSEAKFLIVGDGELHDELRRSPSARELGNRVIWTGIRHDMPAVYRASDVVVLTSDNEGTPVSLIEAQASGVPVVSTNVGGVGTVVLHERTGLLADRDDIDGLARAVCAVLDNRALARRLADAGFRHALSRFSFERLCDDIDRLYRQLLAGLNQ